MKILKLSALTFLFASTNVFSFEARNYLVEHGTKVIGMMSKSSEQFDLVLSNNGKNKTLFKFHISEYPFKYETTYCNSEKLFNDVRPKIEREYKKKAKLTDKSDCEMKIAIWKSQDDIEYGFDITLVTGFNMTMNYGGVTLVTTEVFKNINDRNNISYQTDKGIFIKWIK